MEKKKTELSEQHAPEKNTDNSFVRVDRDGSPKIPEQLEKDPQTVERAREEHAPKK